MRRALCGWAALAWIACSHPAEPRTEEPVERPPPAARTRVHLGERFDLGEVATGCVISEARPYFAEREAPPDDERPPADVLVLRIRATCESGQKALGQASWYWVSPEGHVAKPSETTTTPPAEPPNLQQVFEVRASEVLPPTRWRFAPDRDWPTGGAGEVRLRSPNGDADVVLEDAPRDISLHTKLEQTLEAFASSSSDAALACEAPGCRERIRALQGAGAFTQTLEVVDHALDAKRAKLTLAPARDPQAPSFHLVFARRNDAFTLGDVELTRRQAPAAPCEMLQKTQRAALREAFAKATGQGEECNVLGWLWPQRCADIDQEGPLWRRAMRAARACGDASLQSLLARGRRKPPSDFQVTLRRDRCRGALDRCPRYTVVVYGNGATVFHGKHRVSRLGRSDGRTHDALLSGLWQALRDMDFLTRHGDGFSHAPKCAARGSDEGNLIRVQAAGKSRMLVDREGCRGPFSAEELERLAQLVDAAAQVTVWTGARPTYADRQVRIWTLSDAAR